MSDPGLRDLVRIHADESCLGNQFSDRPTPGGAAGMIEMFDDRRGWIRKDYFVSERDTTNNRMALRSAIEGLRVLRRPCRVIFHSDSQYLVTGMKEWVHAWAARGWKRKGGAIENLELWQQLVAAAARHRIEWRWVRGHAGDAKNEYVNKLAIRAAREQIGSGGPIPSGFDEWIREQQDQGRYLDFYDVPQDEPFRPDDDPPASG